MVSFLGCFGFVWLFVGVCFWFILLLVVVCLLGFEFCVVDLCFVSLFLMLFLGLGVLIGLNWFACWIDAFWEFGVVCLGWDLFGLFCGLWDLKLVLFICVGVG